MTSPKKTKPVLWPQSGNFMANNVPEGLSSRIGLLWKLCWAILLLYAAFHLLAVYKAAVDIPYLDEWDIFAKDGIVLGWTKDFILSFSMDHRTVLTKIIYLLNQDLFHLNFRYQILFNVL